MVGVVHAAAALLCVLTVPRPQHLLTDAGTSTRRPQTNTAICLRPPCAGAGACEQMQGTRHREHAQKGGGGVDGRYHTRDELHRIPEGLCMDVVAFAAAGGAAEIE